MASITRSFEKPPEQKLRAMRIFVCVLVLAGASACAPSTGDFGFRIERVETRATGATLAIVVHQNVDLSAEARKALRHGVPLFIRTEITLRPHETKRNVARSDREFEIRYLPLSNLYQVTTTPSLVVKTFPRLRHVLAEVGTVDFGFNTSSLSSADLEVRVRSSLNKRRMPPPMRLPAWFSAEWQHDSGWTSWSVESGRAAG